MSVIVWAAVGAAPAVVIEAAPPAASPSFEDCISPLPFLVRPQALAALFGARGRGGFAGIMKSP